MDFSGTKFHQKKMQRKQREVSEEIQKAPERAQGDVLLRAKSSGQKASVIITPQKASKFCSQLLNVCRLAFFKGEPKLQSKKIKKSSEKNPSSKRTLRGKKRAQNFKAKKALRRTGKSANLFPAYKRVTRLV